MEVEASIYYSETFNFMLIILKLKWMVRNCSVTEDAKGSNFWKDLDLVQTAVK